LFSGSPDVRSYLTHVCTAKRFRMALGLRRDASRESAPQQDNVSHGSLAGSFQDLRKAQRFFTAGASLLSVSTPEIEIRCSEKRVSQAVFCIGNSKRLEGSVDFFGRVLTRRHCRENAEALGEREFTAFTKLGRQFDEPAAQQGRLLRMTSLEFKHSQVFNCSKLARVIALSQRKLPSRLE